jgi:Abi-like protein
VNFQFTPERLAALERSLSRERLTYYLGECANDLERALRMYELNNRISAAFYGPLQGLEVLVRNDMNTQMQAAFGADWLDLSAVRLQPTQIDDIKKTIAKIDQDEPSNGAIVAELPFGFWVGLLGPKNENEIWRKALHKAFAHRPRGTERKIVHNALDSIRRLRNRIAHHEKILHRDLRANHATILEIAGWCCPVTRDWIASLSNFDADMLPVQEAELPLPTIDQPKPIDRPARETLGGRRRLSLK